MIKRIKRFFEVNQEALPDLALIALFFAPIVISSEHMFTLKWLFITSIFFVIGWIFVYVRKAFFILICIVGMWIPAYICAIDEGNDYGYTIGTIILITTLPYWLFAKHGFRKFLLKSKNKKG